MRLLSRNRRSQKVGLPPGSLVYTGARKGEKTTISAISYDESNFEQRQDLSVEECLELKKRHSVTWIDVEGLHEVDKLEKLGQVFGIHPLVMEDILNIDQRPKTEDYGDYIYIVLHMLFRRPDGEVGIDQLSIILGKDFVISFQEEKVDVFDPILDRIKNSKGKIRRLKSDYLAYSLIDAIVDRLFVVVEKFGTRIDEVEDALINQPASQTLQDIHKLKRDMFLLRRSLWPLRELLGTLERGESDLICDGTLIYLRDVHDHAIYLMDTIETCRDVLSSMLDIYLSSISNRMNEVMKVLTIIATLFMPLTFIAGIYGMNFEFMPELHFRLAYPLVLAVMVIIVVVMILFFRKKKWI